MSIEQLADGTVNLTFYRGRDYAAEWTLVDVNSAPIDYTGFTFTSQIRARTDAADPIAFTVDASQIAVGIVKISLDAATTAGMLGSYSWDLRMDSPAANVLAGKVIVLPDVTRP